MYFLLFCFAIVFCGFVYLLVTSFYSNDLQNSRLIKDINERIDRVNKKLEFIEKVDKEKNRKK